MITWLIKFRLFELKLHGWHCQLTTLKPLLCFWALFLVILCSSQPLFQWEGWENLLVNQFLILQKHFHIYSFIKTLFCVIQVVFFFRYINISPLLVCAEVADACAFLASDDSRYITGISLEVAGKTLDLQHLQKPSFSVCSELTWIFLFNRCRWTLHWLKTVE